MIMDLNTIVSRYRENGFASGLPALSTDQARSMRSCIEQLEMDFTEGAGGYSGLRYGTCHAGACPSVRPRGDRSLLR